MYIHLVAKPAAKPRAPPTAVPLGDSPQGIVVDVGQRA